MTGFLGTVINSYVQTLIDTACARGADRNEMLRPLQGETSILDQPGKRLSMNLMTRLWQHIAEVTADPDLGLHVGEAIRPGSFHILAPVIMNCETLYDTIEMVVRYQSLVSEGGVIDCIKAEAGMKLTYTPGSFPIPMTRFQIECIFSGIVTFTRWLLNNDISPCEVNFVHTVPHGHDEYKRIFRCPVVFGHNENAMVIASTFLNLKIPHADPDLRRHHQEMADRFMVHQTNEHKIIIELEELLHSWQDSGRLSLAKAAEALKLSPRTLQRRLQKAASSFHEVQNNVLMSKAHDLLLSTDLPVSRIAEDLGYLNNSSFHRRFKNWYGMTPHTYRQKALGKRA